MADSRYSTIIDLDPRLGIQPIPIERKEKDMATLNQYPLHVGPQSPSVAEYAFPSVLQFLQTEWRRFERDRNEWDIEKAEMKVLLISSLYSGLNWIPLLAYTF